jgi:putative transposase
MPSEQYFVRNENEMYFITSTIVEWVDVFTRPVYKNIIVDSLKYCQEHKGLDIYAWVLMSNHLHAIVSAREGYKLSDILRDFKKFTSKRIIDAIKEEPESRRDWLLYRFEYAGKFRTNIENYKVWQDGNHAKECFSPDFTIEKLVYIHNNPVRALIVETPEHYLYSSARNYAGLKGLLEIKSIY